MFSFCGQRVIEIKESGTLLGLDGERGRFGWALASLADLNGDEIREVAVGAPLEDDGRGSLYIFNGRTGGINPTYSQVRIDRLIDWLIGCLIN